MTTQALPLWIWFCTSFKNVEADLLKKPWIAPSKTSTVTSHFQSAEIRMGAFDTGAAAVKAKRLTALIRRSLIIVRF